MTSVDTKTPKDKPPLSFYEAVRLHASKKEIILAKPAHSPVQTPMHRKLAIDWTKLPSPCLTVWTDIENTEELQGHVFKYGKAFASKTTHACATREIRIYDSRQQQKKHKYQGPLAVIRLDIRRLEIQKPLGNKLFNTATIPMAKRDRLKLMQQWDRDWKQIFRDYCKTKKTHPNTKRAAYAKTRRNKMIVNGQQCASRFHVLSIVQREPVGDSIPIAKEQQTFIGETNTQQTCSIGETKTQQLVQIWHVPPMPVAVKAPMATATAIPTHVEATATAAATPTSVGAATNCPLKSFGCLYCRKLAETEDDGPAYWRKQLHDQQLAKSSADPFMLLHTMVDANLTDSEMNALGEAWNIDTRILPSEANRKAAIDGGRSVHETIEAIKFHKALQEWIPEPSIVDASATAVAKVATHDAAVKKAINATNTAANAAKSTLEAKSAKASEKTIVIATADVAAEALAPKDNARCSVC